MERLTNQPPHIDSHVLSSLRSAAGDRTRVSGLTHCFYKYPARFSPRFVGSAIEAFTSPGDVVLDPYMGGGTSIVEAVVRGRQAVGSDINSLALFIAKAKTTPLQLDDHVAVRKWAADTSELGYHTVSEEAADLICPIRTKNLHLARSRPAKKFIAQAMLALGDLPHERTRNFARCVLLNVAQWALNNRRQAPSLSEIRTRVIAAAEQMLVGLREFEISLDSHLPNKQITLIHGSATELPTSAPFLSGTKAHLAITSPPYPGIHVLYHRWQVDGRKETPAPYWIADCMDGKGSSFYNFSDRRDEDQEGYFAESLKTLRAIRSVLADDAVMVQMIAFARPRAQLVRYLRNMTEAGFAEIRNARTEDRISRFQRIWRCVPGRAWHAAQMGNTPAAREVVLIHRAA